MKATLKRSILVICCLLVMMFGAFANNGAMAAEKTTATKATTDKASTKVRKIKLNKTKLSLYYFGGGKGQMEQLKVSAILPKSASKAVTWSSSNKKVAKVSSDGKVTAVGKGTCTITAKSKITPKIKATCKVTVTTITPRAFYKQKMLPKMNDIYKVLKLQPSDIKTNINKVVKAAGNIVAYCQMHPKFKGTPLTHAKKLQSYIDTIESRCDHDYLPDDSTLLNAVKNANNTLKKLKTYCNNKF